jgi:hypothetical protein
MVDLLMRSGAGLLLGAAGVRFAIFRRLFTTRTANGTTQELGLILHHVRPFAATGRVLTRSRGCLTGLDDRLLGLLDGSDRLTGRARLVTDITAVIPLAAVIGALEPPVAVAGVVAAVMTTFSTLAAFRAALVAAFGAMILLAAMLAAIVTPFVTALVVASILVARLHLGLRFLTRMAHEGGDRGLVAQARIGGLAVALLTRLAHIGAVHGAMALAIAVGCIAALLNLLFAVGDDHAVVVFGVLEIVLGEDGVA